MNADRQPTTVYDRIGKTYDATRRADTRILEQLIALLGLPASGRVLDVGCGSGNYTMPLARRGYAICGVDISAGMLSKARRKHPSIPWVLADARCLPLGEDSFDAVICVLATHHMQNLDVALCQMARVLKPGGRLVLFTSTPAQMQAFWLNHYLPTVVAITRDAMTDYATLQAMLRSAGLSAVRQQLFFVDGNLEDWFLQCGKYRPEVYLDAVVRAGISTFALCDDAEALRRGLEQLEADIQSGAVSEVIERYEGNTLGDFMFVSASSPTRRP